MQRRLRDGEAAAFTASVTGLEEGHPLFPAIVEVVRARQAELG